MVGNFVLALVLGTAATADAPALNSQNHWPYDPSEMLPFGAPNPEQTDPEARVFDPMIGMHDCKSTRRNYTTGEETETDLVWKWHYSLNGYGVTDDFRSGPNVPISQRLYDPATKQWHVWYMLGQKFYYVAEWIGGQKDDRIVLEKPGEKLGDKTILSRLVFFDISEEGFSWQSTNIDPETDELLFVDWDISCKKRL